MQTTDAGGTPVDRPVGRLVPEHASTCGLTECQGKPQCVRCRRQADMDTLCALLLELLPLQVPNEFGHLLTTQALWDMYVEDGKTPNAEVSGAEGVALDR